jgi:hypothetical protein
MDIFFAPTKITIGNGCKNSFWDAHWLEGRNPKDIASLIFVCSKKEILESEQSVGGKHLGWENQFG